MSIRISLGKDLITALENSISSSMESIAKTYTDKLLSIVTPILKASLINASVTANTDILSSSISPEHSPATFRIYVSFSASGVLSLVRTKNGTTVVEQLNAGNSLNANCAYAFDILVEGDEQINLRYSVDATLLRLIIIEIPGVMG